VFQSKSTWRRLVGVRVTINALEVSPEMFTVFIRPFATARGATWSSDTGVLRDEARSVVVSPLPDAVSASPPRSATAKESSQSSEMSCCGRVGNARSSGRLLDERRTLWNADSWECG
jgi:hypothetical protein